MAASQERGGLLIPLMKKVFQLLCTTILLFFGSSCRKDVGKVILPELPELNVPAIIDSISLPFNCEDTAANWKLQEQDPLFIPIMKTGSLGVHRGIYDPNNSDIIYFIQSDSVGTALHRTHNLYRYDRRTNKKHKLDSDILGNIDVNKNGWLVYDKMSLNICKIKTNGDSLTLLTKNGGCQFPRWSQDGKFIFYIDESSQGGIYKMDRNGRRVDTIKGINSFVTEYNNFLFYGKNTGSGEIALIKYNPELKTEQKVFSIKGTINNWQLVDNSFVYCESESGLYKINLLNLEAVKLINSQRGSMNAVGAFWVSPISGRILAMQMNLIYFNYYYSEVNCYLLEYEPDGKCRRRLTLPD